MMKILCICILLILCNPVTGQTVQQAMQTDAEVMADSVSADSCTAHRFNLKQLIVPVSLTGMGIIGVTSGWLKSQNRRIRDNLMKRIRHRIPIDDYMQYAPIVSVYAMNLCGIRGAHNFRNRTMILATSALIMGISVNTLKYSMRIQRPDGTSLNSFPSGHTAMVFMGAEFLRKEYKDTTPWIGIMGYTVAVGTGFLRMYNNRHWLTDTLAGAGIGIFSVKAAYWLFPFLDKHLLRGKHGKTHRNRIAASPFLSNTGKGVSGVLLLN